MTATTVKRKPGRPPGSTTDRTATIPSARCTPEQRVKFQRLGGADWLRRQIDKAREPT